MGGSSAVKAVLCRSCTVANHKQLHALHVGEGQQT